MQAKTFKNKKLTMDNISGSKCLDGMGLTFE